MFLEHHIISSRPGGRSYNECFLHQLSPLRLLLQANYDILAIQELFGHSDVRPTMIYTHTIKSLTKIDCTDRCITRKTHQDEIQGLLV